MIYRIAFGHKNQAVIFQNPDDRFFCVESAIVAENKTVLIKGSGVDMQHFSPGSPREGVPLVLLAGRMLWEKGVGDFVEAARLIKGYGVAARFVLVGSSVFWNSSSVGDDQLKDWHEEGVIEWWGQRADMTEVFSQTDVVCLPSTYGEGVPKFLIEAAACGKPIVTTDTPGCREIVQDGVNGILVPVENPKAVAKAIGRLLNDPDLREQMGRRGRAIAVEGFDVERVVRQTLSVYRQLLAES
jgi:glycosyltransferase involved in cell wall biosynthesis